MWSRYCKCPVCSDKRGVDRLRALVDAKCQKCSSKLKRSSSFADSLIGVSLIQILFYVSLVLSVVLLSVWPFVLWVLVFVVADLNRSFAPDEKDPVTRMQIDRIAKGQEVVSGTSAKNV